MYAYRHGDVTTAFYIDMMRRLLGPVSSNNGRFPIDMSDYQRALSMNLSIDLSIYRSIFVNLYVYIYIHIYIFGQ